MYLPQSFIYIHFISDKIDLMLNGVKTHDSTAGLQIFFRIGGLK